MDVALVTGSSTGIGESTALHLARNNFHVFATMRNPDAGTALLEAAKSEGLRLEVLALDVNDADSCSNCVGEIVNRAGRIDILVNNAGIGSGGPLEEASMEHIREVFETNVFGAVRMMQLVLPGMRERRQGTIVNVTSVAGRVANPNMSTYSGSKFALDVMTESLAAEVVRFGIRVALIEPGVIQTPIFSKGSNPPNPESPYSEFVERAGHWFGVRLEKPTYPQEVAELIEHAIVTDEPKLRYLVGPDAFSMVQARSEFTDEEWLDTGREMSLEEYVQLLSDRGISSYLDE
jgi:NAD(P)-dependent dehydrogenase (short-subunit alcohol dehydrogenase family)